MATPLQNTVVEQAVVKKRSGSSWLLMEHISLVTSQTKVFYKNLFTHHFHGPRKPSWPVQLSLLVALSHNIRNYQHLGSLERIRLLQNFPNFLVPLDALITPVTFRVRPRGLQGILADLDDNESGTRELTGEWVVSKKHWREANSDGERYIQIDQHGHRTSTEKVFFYLHGGGYTMLSAKTHREMNYRLSVKTGMRVFAVNYGLAPEHPFPGGLHDAVHAYLYLIDIHGCALQPENIIVAGDSAGGGLSMAFLLYLRDHKMPMPSGGVLFSPWVDLTLAHNSWETNKEFDYLYKPEPEDPLNPIKLYLRPYDERSHLINNPYVSPLYADLSNLPPLLIQCGDCEVLRDECVALARRASETGSTFTMLERYEDMPHVFQAFTFLDQARKAMDAVGYFVKNVVPLEQQKAANRNPFNSHQRNYSLPLFLSRATGPVSQKVDKATCTTEDRIITPSPQSVRREKERLAAESQRHEVDKDDVLEIPRLPSRSSSQPDLRKLRMSLMTGKKDLNAFTFGKKSVAEAATEVVQEVVA